MKHAGSEALDRLETFLVRLRSEPGLVERRRGVFYRRGRAFLHFHEDPAGLYADLRVGEDFERFRAETEEERRALLRRIQSAPAAPGTQTRKAVGHP